jgi:RNA polymerase sigma-70 factor (ECF subfamily)
LDNSISATAPEACVGVSTRAGDKSRLEDEVLALFEQFRARLLRYLMTLGLAAHDSEEVVQEVFLALFEHLRKNKPRHNLQAWIFRVAHNLGLKQRNRLQEESKHRIELCDRASGSRPDSAPDPEEQILRSEKQSHLRAVVRALPDQDQWCLYLRAEGLRYREIAETLGMSLGAVSISLGRSLERLARVDGR